MNDNNAVWHECLVIRTDSHILNTHISSLLWFTGLSTSGKSTIAHGVEKVLCYHGNMTYVLDKDNLRHGLNSYLVFSPDDRKENILWKEIVKLSRR